MCSFRREESETVRIHLVGAPARFGHSHGDIGSIVLEIDGIPVLIDRGMVDYYHAEAILLKRSYLHNVLTPVLADGSYPDQSVVEEPIIPRGRGKRQSLEASIDLGNAWRDHMVHYKRTIKSNTIDEIRITDQGQLKAAGRLAFHLHSPFPFKADSNKLVLQTRHFLLEIEADWAEQVSHRPELVNFKHETIYHLMIHSPSCEKFSLNTRVWRT
jgi:hypothetical protein